jgi:hypothetical protein
LETSEEKSVTFWLTEFRVTLTPPARRLAWTPLASGFEYAVWSSTMKTSFAFRIWRMYFAVVGAWTLSFGTTRKKFGIEPLVSEVRVAEPEMNGSRSAFL